MQHVTGNKCVYLTYCVFWVGSDRQKKLNYWTIEISTAWNKHFWSWRPPWLVATEGCPPCRRTVLPIHSTAIHYLSLPVCDVRRFPSRSRFLPQMNFGTHFLRTAAALKGRTGSLHKMSSDKIWVAWYVRDDTCTAQLVCFLKAMVSFAFGFEHCSEHRAAQGTA